MASVSDNNRPEWNFLDNAILSLGAIHVPIYPNIAPEEYEFILKDSGASLIFCSSQRLYELLRPVIPKLPSIKEIYVFDAVPGAKSVERVGLCRQGNSGASRAPESAYGFPRSGEAQ